MGVERQVTGLRSQVATDNRLSYGQYESGRTDFCCEPLDQG